MSSRTTVTQAIGAASARTVGCLGKASEYFAINTFSERTMQEMLSAKTFAAFKKWQEEGKVINRRQADEIADAMNSWAVSKGASSYTHWFQPMTGLTAEKHESFLRVKRDGRVLETFSGDQLIQGEPDASSFPSGGIRTTFEARGYTAWDPSSPAFITEVEQGKTLCIPSIFISYTGEALDKKLPLLRSDEALSRAALDLLKLFGVNDARRVYSECGAEQEYFLIDQSYHKLRTDLQLCGRTLVGAHSPKGQQLEDQYFGSIKERILSYMHEVGQEAYRLGIPLTTRHNEVAPHQFEFAPVYERSNIAADHNQLLMDTMRKVAKRHGLECLLHEKPFAGINGSGKHLNWSITDDRGNNLLDPGDTPEKNLQFLTVLVAVIQAVHHHADLLRASVATAGNEHRLGANEAPPAVMSVFLGDHLTRILETVGTDKRKKLSKKDIIDLGIGMLPRFTRDLTDRNRTSPFAYTGKKFEFRALGSSANISTPLTVLNTIVAESMSSLASRIRTESKKTEFDDAVLKVLADAIEKCRPVLFEGNNYSEEWAQEAQRRKLPNKPSTAQALKAFVTQKNVRIFEKHKVFTRAELNARHNVWLDIYNKMLDIEARTLLEMVGTQVLPTAYNFQITVGRSLQILSDYADSESPAIPEGALGDRKEMFFKLTGDIYALRTHLAELEGFLEQAESHDEEQRAGYFYSQLRPHLEHIRQHVDELESVMPDDMWLLPKYREILFIA